MSTLLRTACCITATTGIAAFNIRGVTINSLLQLPIQQEVIRVKKTHGAAALHTRITWTSFLGLEEPSLKLLRSSSLSARILAQFHIVGVRNRPSLFRVI